MVIKELLMSGIDCPIRKLRYDQGSDRHCFRSLTTGFRSIPFQVSEQIRLSPTSIESPEKCIYILVVRSQMFLDNIRSVTREAMSDNRSESVSARSPLRPLRTPGTLNGWANFVSVGKRIAKCVNY